MGKNILFVDKDDKRLTSLKDSFSESRYNTFFSKSGIEALKIMEDSSIDMIVSDFRLPDMNGYELLKKVKDTHSSVFRLIVSNNDDEHSVKKAMHNNVAKLFLSESIEEENIKCVVDKIFDVEQSLKAKDLYKALSGIEDLPTLQNTYSRLCTLIEKDASMDEFAGVICKDQSMAAHVLRVANSAFYGAKTGSVKQAIMYLGISNVKNIVLTSSIFESIEGNKLMDTQKEILWKHASLTNRIFVETYKRVLNKKIPFDCEAAGLLHDIGKVVIMKNYQKEYIEILKRVKISKNKCIVEAEKEFLGFNHHDVGAHLMGLWELPYGMIEAILFHHTPLDGRVVNKELVAVVHVADYYAWKANAVKQHLQTLNTEVLGFLKINKNDIEQMVNKMSNDQ